MNGRHPRKRIPREEAEKPLPRHGSLLRPTVKPLLPDVHDVEAERRQARGVPPNPEVGAMPAQLPHQHPMLLGDRYMAVRTAPAIDRRQAPPEAVLGGLSLEHPAAVPGNARRWCAEVAGSRATRCELAIGPPTRHDLEVKSRIHPQYKTEYHVRNWAEYDRALMDRGDVTLWLAPGAIASWAAEASASVVGSFSTPTSRSKPP